MESTVTWEKPLGSPWPKKAQGSGWLQGELVALLLPRGMLATLDASLGDSGSCGNASLVSLRGGRAARRSGGCEELAASGCWQRNQLQNGNVCKESSDASQSAAAWSWLWRPAKPISPGWMLHLSKSSSAGLRCS